VRLALKVVMKSDGYFVDVILLYGNRLRPIKPKPGICSAS
jgi:hypothetical protein